MRVIVGDRQSGKTTELVRICRENGYALITFSTQSARLIKRKYEDINVLIFCEVISNPNILKGLKGYVIDDMDMVMVEMGLYPSAISLTGDIKELKTPYRNW